jgi:hypothetical protein
MTSPAVYPSYPDAHTEEMVKRFRQALATAEVEARVDGMAEEQGLELLQRTLEAIHGSTVNRGYARSMLYACTDDRSPGTPRKWSRVLVGCLGLLSAPR